VASLRLYLSGVHSGPNPSPGLGTARALRERFPDAVLIAVDYSPRSTGLHDPVFDEAWIARPWTELDLDVHARQIRHALGQNGLWISGLDLETWWLADGSRAGTKRVLVPPKTALRRTAKPAIAAAAELGHRVPPSVSAALDSWSLDRFCRRGGWRVWVKGPTYEAHPASSWNELELARTAIKTTWGTEAFVQAHVDGTEESIAFAAYAGSLLAAVKMVKLEVTSEGKTWSGAVSGLPPADRSRLSALVRRLRWTGGGEIECVRDRLGEVWVIDWNPRFPAWVYGATSAGYNLPGELVRAALGLGSSGHSAKEEGVFVRAVYELSTSRPVPSLQAERHASSGKHPSGMPHLSRRLSRVSARPMRAPEMPGVETELAGISVRSTPARVFLRDTARRQFKQAAEAVEAWGSASGTAIRMAFSIKTDPDPEVLNLARGNGLLAEAISQLEAAQALRHGWAKSELVMNGPAKQWPTDEQVLDPAEAFLWFADSVEEVVALQRRRNGIERIGLRLRSPLLDSRFGIPLSEPESYHALVRAVRRFGSGPTLAIHFHHASSVVGPGLWRRAAESVIAWASALGQDTGMSVTHLDLGGGWFPDDFDAVAAEPIIGVITEARHRFADLQVVVLEPGKALAQPTKALIVSVLEVRGGRTRPSEVVVDGSIAELGQAHGYPHRVYLETEAGWRPLAEGGGRILGRICMEHDVLHPGLAWPRSVRAGSRLAILDAGAYDSSMAYRFGLGA